MANIAQLPDPVAITKDAANGLGVSADDLRYGFGGLTTPRGGAAYGFRGGVYPGQSNGGLITDMQVMAQATMQTVVQPGNYAIPRAAHGVYYGAVIASVAVTHDASSTANPRLDLVVVRLRDPGYDTGVTQSASIRIIKGDPAAVPVEPTAQLTDGDLVLAAVTVRKNATNIIASDIAERRIFLAGRGGIRPKSSYDNIAPSYEGEYRDNLVTNALERGDANGLWVPVATPAAWTQWTPRLVAESGGDLGLGTSPKMIGKYQLTGKRLDFINYFEWGSGTYNGRAGDIYTFLPPGFFFPTAQPQMCQAFLYVRDAYTGYFIGQAQCIRNSNKIYPMFPRNAYNDSNLGYYRIATTQGKTDGKSSIPMIFNPNGFPQGGWLCISGAVEVQ